MNRGDTTWILSNRRRERAKLLCPGSYTTERFVIDYLQNSLPWLVVAFCLGTGEVGIKGETIIKVKMANCQFGLFYMFHNSGRGGVNLQQSEAAAEQKSRCCFLERFLHNQWCFSSSLNACPVLSAGAAAAAQPALGVLVSGRRAERLSQLSL